MIRPFTKEEGKSMKVLTFVFCLLLSGLVQAASVNAECVSNSTTHYCTATWNGFSPPPSYDGTWGAQCSPNLPAGCSGTGFIAVKGRASGTKTVSSTHHGGHYSAWTCTVSVGNMIATCDSDWHDPDTPHTSWCAY